MRAGLASVTFRKLSPEEILRIMARAGLACIEWGGDVHVPPGKLAAAGSIRRLTEDAGIAIAAYGSYYRLDASEREGLSFESVLETAIELNAPVIRVWAGDRGRLSARPEHYARTVEDALRIAGLAGAAGVKIAFEYHAGTFVDTIGEAGKFLAQAVHPAIYSLWQPPHGQSLDYCMKSLEGVLPRLHHLHVFHWWPDAARRMPLSAGEERWKHYLIALQARRPQCDLLLEFTVNDSPGQLYSDAACLLDWISSVQKADSANRLIR
jgi:sugar phosphate isomerase/epimerase